MEFDATGEECRTTPLGAAAASDSWPREHSAEHLMVAVVAAGRKEHFARNVCRDPGFVPARPLRGCTVLFALNTFCSRCCPK